MTGDGGKTMYALVNCDIYTGEQVEYDKALVIKGTTIQRLVPLGELGDDIDKIDLRGQCIAPGFIDCQVNGGGGVLFNDTPTVGGIQAIAAAHQRFGTTNLLPTFITGSRSAMSSALEAVRTCLAGEAKAVLGIHFEGPFINEAKAGVHDKRHIRAQNEEDVAIFKRPLDGVRLVTLAPETVSLELVADFAQAGVIVSLGHTSASYDEASAALDGGATCVTHLYNAMSALTSRAPGVVGAALDDRGSWAGIIVDGFHSDFVSARIAIRAKAKGKMLLVTDAMPPMGSPSEDFRLGEYEIRVKDGRCVTQDGMLAGSALDMATAVRNCVQQIGLPKDEALRMASTYPAKFLGLDDELGRLAPGYRANITIFNNQIVVSAVVVDGELIEAT